MRKFLILVVAVFAVTVIIPTGYYRSGTIAADNTVISASETEENTEGTETVAVFMADEKTVSEMPMKDYIVCCVGAEMPAAYEYQALCAQALASVTLARYMKENNSSNEELMGAVISTDSKKYQGYMSVDEMKSRWGEDFDKYYKKLTEAVDEVLGYTVTYKGKTAMTAFHAISTGLTEDAKNVWGKSVAYLVNVDSSEDRDSQKYLSTLTLTADELKEKLTLEDVPEDINQWVSDENYTKAGNLRSVNICGESFTGEELRSLLELRSCAISISTTGEDFEIDVRGYGHGVGMSQNGANEMAKEGKTWQEIIGHYYPGTEIEKTAQ